MSTNSPHKLPEITDFPPEEITQPLLLEQLGEWGIVLSAGQLNRLITEPTDAFHAEKGGAVAPRTAAQLLGHELASPAPRRTPTMPKMLIQEAIDPLLVDLTGRLPCKPTRKMDDGPEWPGPLRLGHGPCVAHSTRISFEGSRIESGR